VWKLWKFREIWSSKFRVERAYLWTSGTIRPKKLSHFVEYLQTYWTDFCNLFIIESVLRADDYLIFQFFKGRCHGNQIMLRKCYQRRLIPLAFVALVLENQLQYHGLFVHINSGDDGATSPKNLVDFCLVTPEMTGLICERQVWYNQKTGVFCRISPELDGFSQSFHHMKALYMQMMDLYLIFQGTLLWQPNNVAIMKANWYYVHSLHVC